MLRSSLSKAGISLTLLTALNLGASLDTFNYYLCSPDKTTNFDDTTPSVRIKKSVFMDMFLQASKNNEISPCPFLELKALVSQNALKTENNSILLTEKSFFHRLLAYIKWNGWTLESMPPKFPLSINGKIMNISLGSDFWHPKKVRVSDSQIDLEKLTQEYNNLIYPQ